MDITKAFRTFTEMLKMLLNNQISQMISSLERLSIRKSS